MSKKIYVGNLPFSVTLDKLKELFSSYGEIDDAIVITDKHTRRSRGFGFVSFVNDADAERAIAEMNKKVIEERELNVKEAKPLEERSKEEQPKEEFKEKVQEEETKE